MYNTLLSHFANLKEIWYIYTRMTMSSSEKQIHIRLPFELFSRLKVKCASEVTSIQDFVAGLIETTIQSEASRRQSGDDQKATKPYILKLLRDVPLFRNANENELEKIADVTVVLHFRKREIILRENEIPTSFYIIKKGMVKIFKNLPMGKEFIIGLCDEGEIFIPSPFIKGIPNFASVMALDDTIILAVRKEDFLEFVDRNPVIRLRIAELDREIIDNFYDKMIDLATTKADFRLMKVLNSLCSKYGKTLNFTHEEIAGMSLTTVETATRFLNQLKNRRVITTSRGKITIIDREKLHL